MMSSRLAVLDHGYVQLIDRWGNDQMVVEAARMSTGKPFEGWGGWTCKDCGVVDDTIAERLNEPDARGSCGHGAYVHKSGAEKLLAYLWEHQHGTPFEMAGMTFEVQLPIFVAREWMRHRVPFGYNEASARYAPLPNVHYLPTVERLMLGGGHLTRQAAAAEGKKPLDEAGALLARAILHRLFHESELAYVQLQDLGVPLELARGVVCVNRYTRMRVTANLRGWLSLAELRIAPTAQWEFRQFARMIWRIGAGLFPRIHHVARKHPPAAPRLNDWLAGLEDENVLAYEAT